MLPCRHHAFQRTDCLLPPFLSVFSPTSGLPCLRRFEKISFPSTSNGCCSSSLFLDQHRPTGIGSVVSIRCISATSFFDKLSLITAQCLQHQRDAALVLKNSSTQFFFSYQCVIIMRFCNGILVRFRLSVRWYVACSATTTSKWQCTNEQPAKRQ